MGTNNNQMLRWYLNYQICIFFCFNRPVRLENDFIIIFFIQFAFEVHDNILSIYKRVCYLKILFLKGDFKIFSDGARKDHDYDVGKSLIKQNTNFIFLKT